MTADRRHGMRPGAVGVYRSDIAGATSEEIEAAIRSRAHDLGYLLMRVLIDATLPEVLSALRRCDAVAVITYDLAHIGGSPKSVCAIAALATVEPASFWRWGYHPDW